MIFIKNGTDIHTQFCDKEAFIFICVEFAVHRKKFKRKCSDILAADYCVADLLFNPGWKMFDLR